MTDAQAALAAYLRDYLRTRAAEVGYDTAASEIAYEANHVRAHGTSTIRFEGMDLPQPPRFF